MWSLSGEAITERKKGGSVWLPLFSLFSVVYLMDETLAMWTVIILLTDGSCFFPVALWIWGRNSKACFQRAKFNSQVLWLAVVLLVKLFSVTEENNTQARINYHSKVLRAITSFVLRLRCKGIVVTGICSCEWVTKVLVMFFTSSLQTNVF